jgi:hypothetical protein
MGLVTNLITNDPEKWPRQLRPIAKYSPVIGAAIVIIVTVRALWRWWRRRIPSPMWVGGNPYPGLAAYGEDRAAVFFGRGQEIRDLVDRVQVAVPPHLRFVPVVGPSGSGKSSLVLAGLLPAIRSRSEWTVLPSFTPGTSSVAELGRLLGLDLGPWTTVLRFALESWSDYWAGLALGWLEAGYPSTGLLDTLHALKDSPRQPQPVRHRALRLWRAATAP